MFATTQGLYNWVEPASSPQNKQVDPKLSIGQTSVVIPMYADYQYPV